MRTLILAGLGLAGVAAGLAWQLSDEAPQPAPHVAEEAGRAVPSPAVPLAVQAESPCSPRRLAGWSLLNIERDAAGHPVRAQLWSSGRPPQTLMAGQSLDGPLRLDRVDGDRVELACDATRRELRLAGSTSGGDTTPLHTALAAPHGN